MSNDDEVRSRIMESVFESTSKSFAAFIDESIGDDGKPVAVSEKTLLKTIFANGPGPRYRTEKMRAFVENHTKKGHP